MAKKYIDIMDTTFRDGFESVFDGRVLIDDLLPAVEVASKAGISHFEFGGETRFSSPFLYLRENAFYMMDKFREITGANANLQVLSNAVNTVMPHGCSREMIDLFAKLFAKHSTSTVRNFDALNSVNNLKYSSEYIKQYNMNHEVVVMMTDLDHMSGAEHNVAFYGKTIRDILDSGIVFDSVCFKDASGTSNPHKVYETISMARKLLGDAVHLRFNTRETAGVSVASYLAALEAGANGIDLAAYPVSGGKSQPDIITMLHATKGTDFNLGDLDSGKIVEYEKVLNDCLSDYMKIPELTQVSPISALASKEQTLESTDENSLDMSDKDEKQSIAYFTEELEKEGLTASDENIFIVASFDIEGIAFLKGEGQLMVKKGKFNNRMQGENMSGNYTVMVDGKKYSVQVAEGDADIQISAAATTTKSSEVAGKVKINAQTPGNVWKVLVAVGDKVEEGQKIMILEAMKMEIDIFAPQAGVIASLDVTPEDSVVDGQLLASLN